ncbi:NTP transferase domain-containing protein [Bacillus mangrovi]|uniref:NTP transferase domain-containing protein n=1 Tax=Metabacillus mangrovi TaxID=1491830 RepID=A0A7X2S368_9BACI|nr:NDP-sugar synthase [Metabacillus mangrovi]MTH52420.1 NTP transferase domain-containing protein [Metabacillus mangrovi]
MKAVILAGGFGSRLQPLTSIRPKPMVPLLNKPVLEYTIEHLKRHGMTELILALCWKSSIIERHFGDGSAYGVRISYVREKEPLGTAGCLKAAEPLLQDTFLVISGDTVSSFDLAEGTAAHKKSGCMATIFAASKSQTGEYGTLIADGSGKVMEFLEKPHKTEVYSESINSGLYVFEPEILEYIDSREPQDISRDVLPKLLKRGVNMHQAAGYWSDIGSHGEYRSAQFDMLDGVKLISPDWALNGTGEKPVCIEEGCFIEQGAILEGPLLIGSGTVVEKGSRIGPYAIIGAGSHIESDAVIRHSILWDLQQIRSGAVIEGAVIASRCDIYPYSELKMGSVLGENVILEGENIVQNQVKIWPGQVIGKAVQVEDSFCGRYFAEEALFMKRGRIELSPAYGGSVQSAKAAQAFAAACGKTGILCGTDGNTQSSLLAAIFTESLRSFGCPVMIEKTPVSPSGLRNGCCNLNKMGLYFLQDNETVFLHLFDASGQIISSEIERSIETHFQQATMAVSSSAGTKTKITGLEKELAAVLSGCHANGLNIGIELDELASRFHKIILEKSGFRTFVHTPAQQFITDQDFTFRLNEKEQTLELAGSQGMLPLTGTVLREVMQVDAGTDTPIQLLYALLQKMKTCPHTAEQLNLYSKAVCKFISCKAGFEGRLLGQIILEEEYENVHLAEGVNIRHGESSWTRIAASREDAMLTVITVDRQPEVAEKMNTVYSNKINTFKSEK